MTDTNAGLSESQGATRSELEALAPALSLEKMSRQVADDLNAAILNYRDAKDPAIQAPVAGEVDSDFALLNKRATALHDVIANLDSKILNRIAAADLPATEDLAAIIKKMGSQLERVAKACEGAIQAGKEERSVGTTDKAALQKLILSLMVIFERETGKEAGNSWDPRKNIYFSPFFDLVSGVIEIADPNETFSNSSLGSQITRALMKAKELSRDYFARILARTSRQKGAIGQPSA